MTSYNVEQLPSPFSVLGEGPHWCSEQQSLYYNDIYGGTIHRYDYIGNTTYTAKIDGYSVISFIIPVKNETSQFIIGTERSITLIEWDGVSQKAKYIETVGEVEANLSDNRFNDAKIDPCGRFYGGTMRLEEKGDIFEARLGSFYRYDAQRKQFVVLKENVGVSNGLCWNETLNLFYYIDSCDLDVKEYSFDSNGNLSNERVVIDFRVSGKRPSFVPDGMTIDTNGFLYVATFGGSAVYKIDPSDGKILMKIKIPAEQVTSVAFGGPNLDILFVTTAAIEFQSSQPAPAGALFKVTGLGAKGRPMHSFALN
ncbi:regucalcin-like [Malaya genurostris]|uniref:regucalcin-like n=1 Tax=Malaya genurostris TaxID=325434 RepID=UPI0026F3F570|nr:regucalcin-like [Malaya genurostris]XP_058468164.1 regucalcin-like [Malaya genurostris]